jgi:hypothetical protein
VTQMKLSFFFKIHIHIPLIWSRISYKTLDNLFNSAQFLSSEVSNIYNKCTHLILLFNPGAIWPLVQTLFLYLHIIFNINTS